MKINSKNNLISMKVITFVLGACLCVFVSCKSANEVVQQANVRASFSLPTEDEQEINNLIAKMSLA